MEFQHRLARMAPASRDLLDKISIELACEEALKHAPELQEERTVPVIDLSRSDEECADAIWQAAEEIGFFKLKNHGITEREIEEMFQLDEQLMKLPREVKEARFPFDRDEIRGYEYKKQVHPSTGTHDQKENLLIPARAGSMDGKWPDAREGLSQFECRTRSFTAKCHALSLRVVGLLEARLGMEPGAFAKTHTLWTPQGKCVFRLLHYPPIDNPMDYPDNVWRCGAHTDFATFTLLFQRPGETGLECASNPLSHRNDGVIRYTAVDPEPGTISCNIGDMLMKMSDDRLLSNLHRVRMPSPGSAASSRYSMAFFLQPDRGTMVESKKYGTHSAEDLMRARCHAYWESPPEASTTAAKAA
jgi:isopenicillin N synthase-like dioxygenase